MTNHMYMQGGLHSMAVKPVWAMDEMTMTSAHHSYIPCTANRTVRGLRDLFHCTKEAIWARQSISRIAALRSRNRNHEDEAPNLSSKRSLSIQGKGLSSFGLGIEECLVAGGV